MRRGLRWTAAILMLGGLASCGQSEGARAPSSPAPPLGVYTLSASGCSYEGNDKIAAGRGSINRSRGVADDGGEFRAHIQEAQRRRLAGEPELGHPTFANLSTSTTVFAGTGQSLAIPGEAGTYGMACIPWKDGPTGMFAAGPVEISR